MLLAALVSLSSVKNQRFLPKVCMSTHSHLAFILPDSLIFIHTSSCCFYLDPILPFPVYSWSSFLPNPTSSLPYLSPLYPGLPFFSVPPCFSTVIASSGPFSWYQRSLPLLSMQISAFVLSHQDLLPSSQGTDFSRSLLTWHFYVFPIRLSTVYVYITLQYMYNASSQHVCTKSPPQQTLAQLAHVLSAWSIIHLPSIKSLTTYSGPGYSVDWDLECHSLIVCNPSCLRS